MLIIINKNSIKCILHVKKINYDEKKNFIFKKNALSLKYK